jgi:hypothetical protein
VSRDEGKAGSGRMCTPSCDCEEASQHIATHWPLTHKGTRGHERERERVAAASKPSEMGNGETLKNVDCKVCNKRNKKVFPRSPDMPIPESLLHVLYAYCT